MTSFATQLRAAPLIPVLTIDDLSVAESLVLALQAGGLKNVEVTLRTPVALEAIALMKAAAPDLLIGAGTVLSEGDVEACFKVGADFIVTPGTSPRLRVALLQADANVMVGVATATEVMSRLEEGFGVLKFFPAEQSGGAAALKSFAGPLPDARFCPTGGVTADKIEAYLALPNVVAVGGTWIATPELIAARDFPSIEANARKAAGYSKS
ncbi:bifunctional 4-hydroxy-2-oxoglutarate aldolase/2-dehydro-3-deoxy-phosphogluconate aldolase [Candidatus Phycosocius spiralis]|uniref:2-dehydro-3-deoxy-phosphogluconate aldolase n=1 Tax=Candidatus Phycosocius spiralis TaxID=2815099 RepID=A0ABQ4PXJ1_9PROT|nr:bifunctional 4-hydroxy-2-oxoglutarate aldolase/2-dehydro-3-deoxy-phosphogluconate aldolase [Candidatus Phycosocius spiralis]GIU67757.1 ketohydroxyglutarate aldolase [Candidatus Phycosocius spiralis]